MTTQITVTDRDEAVALRAICAIEDEIEVLSEQLSRARADLAVCEETFKNLRESLAGNKSEETA